MRIILDPLAVKINETRQYLWNVAEVKPEILIILGSSFGQVSSNINVDLSIPYESIPHFPICQAPTHAGYLIFGEILSKKVMVMNGRFHVYEGHTIKQTVYPIAIAESLGAKTMISTNLVGGVCHEFNVGDFMVVEDHLNLTGLNPLQWEQKGSLNNFTDMFRAYSPELIRTTEETAKEQNIPLKKGILAYLTGPSFETRAELTMLKKLGSDAIGWSLVPEALMARGCGLAVLGISCISDISNPEHLGPVDLDALYRVGVDRQDDLHRLLTGVIAKL